jgi:hypothetical protein
MHPIYVQIGIIPEIASGIHAASVLQQPPETNVSYATSSAG